MFLAARVLFHEDRTAGEGVQFGVIHQAGIGGGGGGEDLHLFRVDMQFLAGEVFQAQHVLTRCSRGGRRSGSR